MISINFEGFVDEFALRSELTKKDSKNLIQQFIDIVVDTLSTGEDVSFYGFGTFKKKKVPSVRKQNPRTKQYMMTKEFWTARFSAGDAFKRVLNEEDETE